ncbi:MAG: class I SAM-dependent methyltransferase [Kofleriaceae bacterium]|nr:MAG: class I SAM-dependent methyltransferase [Kofleriaceae bacterium]MBZ0238297.1 class I SAM-dependent methyltransferase [Kofleriaceae bacterium]
MTTSTTPAIDSARAEAFQGRLGSLLNDSFLALLISVGHRTGLFDRMCELPPSSSETIARAAGLHERYVREWLAAMVTGRIVDYDGARRTYQLPAEHARLLTRAAKGDNLAVITQIVGELGKVEDDIVHCFRAGGGVPYERYHRFHELQAELTAPVFDATLIDAVLPMTGMLDALRAGISVLDVGCGLGRSTLLMARAFPASRFCGLDLCADPVLRARRAAAEAGLTNVSFERGDAAELAAPARFELVTAFDVIHDQARPAEGLAGIRAALRPGGTFLCVDIAASSNLADNLDHPLAPMLYASSTLHCTAVSLAQGGAGLGSMWGQELALKMLAEAGFRDVAVQKLDGDVFNNYYIAR